MAINQHLMPLVASKVVLVPHNAVMESLQRSLEVGASDIVESQSTWRASGDGKTL
jgi:hypothetical protein